MRNLKKEKHTIKILPDGRWFAAERGERLMEALAGNDILLQSRCGGKGLCGKCLVRITESSASGASSPDDSEARILGKEELQAGYRLACRVQILHDLSVEIPPASLLSPDTVPKAPLALPETVSLARPSTTGSAGRYGLAVDLGTTTIAVYLCDLASGGITGSLSIGNPQAMFGDDVLSRIGFAAQSKKNLLRLQKMAVGAMDRCAEAVCRSTHVDPGHIGSAVVVGNSIMIHIFAGVDPRSIGAYPYRPVFLEDRTFKAGSVGLAFNPSADIFTPPLISGFLGSDILAAALAVDLDHAACGTLLADIGTNGEAILKGREGLLAASCATGPAFEAATIRHGMQAVSGAIAAVSIDRVGDRVICSVIPQSSGADCLPSGICGSGVVSAVAELYRTGLLSGNGLLVNPTGSSLIRRDKAGLLEFELAGASQSQTQRPITLTQTDIRAVQLAKGALFTGMKMLCAEAGIASLERLLVAGAFGNFLDIKAALMIGMFPDLPEDCIAMVGNAAATGAALLLFKPELRDQARNLARSVKVLDLAARPDFQDLFLRSLAFPAWTS